MIFRIEFRPFISVIFTVNCDGGTKNNNTISIIEVVVVKNNNNNNYEKRIDSLTCFHRRVPLETTNETLMKSFKILTRHRKRKTSICSP